MSLEYYKKHMIDLRAKLDKEKEAKKKDNERYAGLIKKTTSADNKADADNAISHILFPWNRLIFRLHRCINTNHCLHKVNCIQYRTDR